MDAAGDISREELVAALLEANQEILRLQAQIDESKWLGDALRRRTLDLSERTKELECLYGVADCLRDLDADLDAVLARIAAVIPRGFQNPAQTYAAVEVANSMFRSPAYRETPCRQSARIMAAGKHVGDIHVLVEPPAKSPAPPPFLDEELDMLNAIAVWIGQAVEHRTAKQS
jgi:GAF domain-containing protein